MMQKYKYLLKQSCFYRIKYAFSVSFLTFLRHKLFISAFFLHDSKQGAPGAKVSKKS